MRFAAELHRLNAIRNPMEKKIQLTRAQGFPESVFTDLLATPDRQGGPVFSASAGKSDGQRLTSWIRF